MDDKTMYKDKKYEQTSIEILREAVDEIAKISIHNEDKYEIAVEILYAIVDAIKERSRK